MRLSQGAARLWMSVSLPHIPQEQQGTQQKLHFSEGVAFTPFVWTPTGRPHLAVVHYLRYAAEQAAHKTSSNLLLAHWHLGCQHEIQVAIQHRGAAMACAMLAKSSAADLWLLAGHTEGAPACTGRASPLCVADLVGNTADEQ